VTLGSSESLNRFDCYLIEDVIGGYELRVVLKKEVPEGVGVPHLAEDSS
jgi:hypothetical protein